MRAQERLEVLLEQGAIQEVLRPLMSGKEAEVYLVVSDDEIRVAKIYKTANNRSFKHRAEYTEGRKVRNSRSQRAMSSRSRFGREQEEAAWRNAEVDVIYRLSAAGVRVPEPYVFIDGVLVMELIQDFDGGPAPRLCDVELSPDEAMYVFKTLLKDVQRMLCAGVVHGDLSDFNVLMSPEGPVIIDFPQAVDPAHNRNAKKLLIRDVKNLTSFLSRWAPSLKKTRYAEEMWALYEKNDLDPHTELTGKYKGSSRKANTQSVLDEIAAAARAEYQRRVALGLELPKDMEEQEEEVERVLARGKRRPVKRGKPQGQGSAQERGQTAQGGGQGRSKGRRGGRGERRDERPDLRKSSGGRRDERPDLRKKAGGSPKQESSTRAGADGRSGQASGTGTGEGSSRSSRRRRNRRNGARQGQGSGEQRSARSEPSSRGEASSRSAKPSKRSADAPKQQRRRKPRKGPSAPVVVERRPARSSRSADNEGSAPRRRKPRSKD